MNIYHLLTALTLIIGFVITIKAIKKLDKEK